MQKQLAQHLKGTSKMNVKTLNGANLLLPAKPGDHVWLIVGLGFYEVRECIISQWIYNENGIFCKLKYLDKDTKEPIVELRIDYPIDDFSKYIFLAESDAKMFCDKYNGLDM